MPLYRSLESWLPTILKSTYADHAEATLVDDGILVVVTWNYKGTGEWRRLFTNAELVSHTSARPGAWTGSRRMCGLARQVISDVLSQRGV